MYSSDLFTELDAILLIKKKERYKVDFAILADHRIKEMESEKKKKRINTWSFS